MGTERPYRGGAVDDLQGLLEGGEIVRAEDDGSGLAVPGDDHAAVLALHLIHDLERRLLRSRRAIGESMFMAIKATTSVLWEEWRPGSGRLGA